MARIQVLPLTTERAGALSNTPFVLIIDQVTDADRDELGEPIYTPEMVDLLTDEVGARSVLVIDCDLTVANVNEELHQAAQAAVARALCPERTVVA